MLQTEILVRSTVDGTMQPSLFYPSVLYGKFSADPNPSAPSPYLESSPIDGCFYIHALDCYIAP